MIRLHVIAEGQTEEEFVNTILAEHLGYFNISTSVHSITTKRTKNKDILIFLHLYIVLQLNELKTKCIEED
jgi:hypothetical protein